jgi:dihydrofolate reductase
MFSIIVAVDKNNGIGINGKLPWHLKGDMEYFKQVTTKTYNQDTKNMVIMGRKTYESIPEKFRPLPNRINVVVTRNKDYNTNIKDVHIVHSLDEALFLRDNLGNKVDETFLIGGGELYKEGLKHQSLVSMYLTRINETYNCDTFLDELPNDFNLMYCQHKSENNVEYCFEFHKRVGCCM